MKKLKKYLPLIYIAFLGISFLYIRSVLKTDIIDVIEESEETSFEIKPAKVNLFIQSNNFNKTYSVRLENRDSVYDMLDYLRNEEELYFEIVDYTYGTEIEDVLKTTASEGQKWRLYQENEDITSEIKDTLLDDGTNYYLKLEN